MLGTMDFIEKDFDQQWSSAENWFAELSHRRVSLNGILYLIGVRELGKDIHQVFSKEEKQDLMHVAVCRLLSSSGYYVFEGLDQDGWPHYKMLQPPPALSLPEQERLLKMNIIEYLQDEIGKL